MGVRESPSWGVNSVGNFTDSPYTWTGNEVDGKSCKSTFSRPMITGTGFDLEKKNNTFSLAAFSSRIFSWEAVPSNKTFSHSCH